MTLRIATWNINSVRIRIPLLKKLSELAEPDIICLQETKTQDEFFPRDDLMALGYSHLYFREKSYNGVAILSKVECRNVSHMTLAGIDHKRHLAVELPDGTELHNFYVPAGGDIPDPAVNPSFDHKLRFVDGMREWALAQKNAKRKMIILGDFNIAPYEHDVWSHKQLLKIVSHTPVETEKLEALRESLNWCDVAREFIPQQEKLYSWWSYRNRDWRKSDRGRRLDHIWVTPSLKQAAKRFQVIKDARDWESTSDHVPVLLDVAL